MDFLDELQELALGSRLKRLSEQFISQATEIYQHFGLDIHPRWFTLLALLHQKKQVSVVEAADYLGLSQPAISQFCQQLVQRKLVEIVISEKDARKKLITLSQYGQDSVIKMLPVWRAVQQGAEKISREDDNDLYQAIKKCEAALARKSLKQRTIESYHEQY